MLNVIKMAWRNVWRNQRRSVVTIAAMTLALTVEVLYSGLVVGMLEGMGDDVTEMDSGDIQVMAPEYLTKPSLYTVVEDSEAIAAKLESEGFQATERLLSGGLASSGELSSGVAFVGIDPVAEQDVLAPHTAMAEGSWLDDADPKGVLVGRGLARTLDLQLGSELVVFSQAADGSMANELFLVRGILKSVAAGLDRSAVMMTEQSFRELMVMPTGAHKLIVKKPKDSELDAAKAIVEAAAPGQKVMTWSELNPIVAQMLGSVEVMVTVMYLIIYVAVAILILNAMLMAVFERIREFGVLKAIGYSPFQVLSMMIMEGMIQAGVALVAGLVIAAVPMWYLQVHGIDVGVLGGISMVGLTMPAIWNGYYTLSTVQTPVILLFIITFFAVLYPGLKAARLQPVDAMHHQ